MKPEDRGSLMSHQAPNALKDQAVELLKDLGPRRDQLKPKERLNIAQQDMPLQDPIERGKNLDEVALGYSPEQAQVEAMRCIQCKKKPCVSGCPVGLKIPEFIDCIAKGDFHAAAAIIRQDSLLPAICGRVCPQESQCQLDCTVGKSHKDVDRSVSIGRLERFVADWEREHGEATADLKANG